MRVSYKCVLETDEGYKHTYAYADCLSYSHGNRFENFLSESFNVLGDTSFGTMLPALVALIGVVAIAIMSKKKIKGAILWGILGSAVLYYR